jgi:L-iditol 2-dehydrogenase
MKAAVFYDVEDIRLEDVPEPELGDDDVIVEVAACGICGSDLEYYTGRSPVGTADGKGPLILGHEFSGRVVRVGKDAQGVKEGDRVAVNPIQSSAASNLSRSGNPHFDLSVVLGVTTNGGFAQLVRTRAEHAYPLPDDLTDAQGAFVEMLAASLNAVEKAEIELGDLVVIYGPGPVGLSMLQLARRSGGRVAMVGTRDYRLELAKELGAEHVFNTADSSSPYYAADLPEAIRGVNAGELAERAIVATAVEEATQSALDVTGNGSTVVFMGLAGPEDVVRVPMLVALTQDKSIRFSWLYPNQWPKTIRLLREGIVDTSKIITHSIALDRIDEGIQQVIARDDGVIKIVVTPGGGA